MNQVPPNWEKIPVFNKESPEKSFVITADSRSERIPATRIEHWKHFADLLESPFFNREGTQFIFRGHRRFDWGLAPTLGRVRKNEIIDKPLADKQLDYFRRAVRGRLSDSSLVHDGQEDELWAVGQHYGLMTPLLDWTYSPYVALFFAFQKADVKQEDENPYRAIYVLDKTFVADDDLCPDIRVFEPRKDDHGRLVNQAGLFTFSPYDSTIEIKLADTLASDEFGDDELRNASEDEQPGILARYICKIYIKNEDQRGCVRYLRRMNVHHASLFPDLIGASEYCNLVLEEEEAAKQEKPVIQATLAVTQEPDTISATSIIEPLLAADISTRNKFEASSIKDILEKFAVGTQPLASLEHHADEITKSLESQQVTDWYKRDSILAGMRSTLRIMLRKMYYPASARDSVIDAIINKIVSDATTLESSK